MPFHVQTESCPNTIGRDPTVWILDDGAGNSVEVWPANGFNAYRWIAGGEDILYRDPAFFGGVKPTRSGWPILFPFPNRIRDGRFTWDGKQYQLPLGDSSGKNAIHGFAVHRPWRVVADGADEGQAWVSAEFASARDAGEARLLWPGDYELRVTYRLLPGAVLRVEATVENAGATPLPFGLGYHPYFRVAPFGGEQACIDIAAGKAWQLEDSLPTGVTAAFSWRRRPFAQAQFDDVLTDVPTCRPEARECGAMEAPSGLRLVVEAARDFREVVVFTPAHRQAICFEPYTCTTDAINLQQRGVDAGLLVLAPGASWQGWVQVAIMQDSTPAA